MGPLLAENSATRGDQMFCVRESLLTADESKQWVMTSCMRQKEAPLTSKMASDNYPYRKSRR
jgi:hypothetical protein